MRFKDLLKKYREQAFSEREKGDRFERLMASYLQTDPKYANKFKTVWLWNEFPGRSDLGGTDTGIDLVALTNEGDYWAIQCKCYAENTTIDKKSVDSFLSTSSRQFKGIDHKTTRFAHRLWIDTTGRRWGKNADEAIRNQNPPVTRLGLYALEEAPVQWDKLDSGISGTEARSEKYSTRKHQQTALEKVEAHFKEYDRGKIIMACGTGKTFTSLRIAENETGGKGLVLFLVPSIALLGQTLREWTAQALEPINAICICSDPDISKKRKKGEDADFFSTIDLALPASTDIANIVRQFEYYQKYGNDGMTVVFSTYQSIDVISNAQKELKRGNLKKVDFDLIICDEAHRTTGVTLSDEDESAFVKVHDDNNIQAKKRLYMTATPRLYHQSVKDRAAKDDAILCSMDDVNIYGEEVYRIGFGEAVEKDLLTDYKVLILTLSDQDVPPSVQRMIADENYEINSDDASKLIGCINALSKQLLGDDDTIRKSDPDPMKRAVAFCSKIVDSRKITDTFNNTSNVYIDSLPSQKRKQMVSIASKHIDGTMSAPYRDELLGWLKEESDECRILTNVRCLSEGVDVPSLDSVMFLSARNSQVDVVQSVGRVMRKAPNKKYGYIIIPVVVPADVEADKALDDNDRYKVVWTVLNALRAHDDRFNATVNKIDLNRKRPDSILIGRPDYTFDEEGKPIAAEPENEYGKSGLGHQLAMQFEELQSVMYARMVKKVGDRRYWEQWAKSVAQIAERQMERITFLVSREGEHKKAFKDFLTGLQKNINPSITEQQAIEMLSQHIITKPVFEALFEGYSFVENNAVSIAMQKMLTLLHEGAIEKDTETLNKFYDSVRKRAEGIDNAEGKQRIIIELYDKFFKTAFPMMVEQLGIVYTPVEVVDFIIHSVNDVLQKEFGRSISDENIHVLDPFTGTGTFVTRLLQSGLIKQEDLSRKYRHELHANEIVLLAYYIAAVNIENAYHDLLGQESEYESFDGICLTDTFQLGEFEGRESLFSDMFPQNSERVEKQMKAPLRVILGNPPYSVGQRSANDNAQNQSYDRLDGRIAATYAKATEATNKNSLYDSYIKAFRWASDRLDNEFGGIVGFVSNGAWIDGNSQDGFRKVLEKEFSSIYIFNLRGNARTQGELRRKEAGNVFKEGSRTPISITLLVKNPKSQEEKATIYYHDIGDYLNRNEKLQIIQDFSSVLNEKMEWRKIKPNQHGDWINKRNDAFENYIPIGDKSDKSDKSGNSFFQSVYGRGVSTARDAWCYNFNRSTVTKRIGALIEFYNDQRIKFHNQKKLSPKLEIGKFLDYDSKLITWNRGLKNDLKKNKPIEFNQTSLVNSLYRPYVKQKLYFARELNDMVYQVPKQFPNSNLKNLVICVSGVGASKDFSALIADIIPDLQLQFNGQCFPLYYYEKRENQAPSLFDQQEAGEYIQRDGISDFILTQARKAYGKLVTKEDIFYYVYGILHSPDYREAFKNDLKKMLPRLPLVDEARDFWKFSKAGRALADLHINYESVPAFPDVKVTGFESGFYRVEKMRFIKKGRKDTIVYNSKVLIENIPDKAYKYVVNGKSAIEWIMERYQVTTDKKSGITNDPNDWSEEVGNERYILDLLLSVINVSVQTVDIVEGLPRLEFE